MVTELVPKSGFYDFDAKYTDGMTEHVCPAEIPEDIARLCLDYALRAHKVLGCRGVSRTDFRWDDERGEDGLFLLETNTQPGMTPLSLVPEQARHCGIEYGELCEIVIEDALRHFGKIGGGGLMAQTIRRKQTGVRRQARAAGYKRQVRKARAQTSTLVDTLMRVLPFTEEQLHRFFLFLILLVAAVGAWFVASLAGLNILIDRQFAAAAANAGFEVAGSRCAASSG